MSETNLSPCPFCGEGVVNVPQCTADVVLLSGEVARLTRKLESWGKRMCELNEENAELHTAQCTVPQEETGLNALLVGYIPGAPDMLINRALYNTRIFAAFEIGQHSYNSAQPSPADMPRKINPYSQDSAWFAPPPPERRKFTDTWMFAYLLVIAGMCAVAGMLYLIYGRAN